MKSLSRLSTIAEEAERSGISDDDCPMVANTNEVERKGKRKHNAGRLDPIMSQLDLIFRQLPLKRPKAFRII